MGGQDCDGEGDQEGEATHVLEEHVRENINLVGEEQVGQDHVGEVGGGMDQGEEDQEVGRVGGRF